jgi:Tfp pilus assembly protein PilN
MITINLLPDQMRRKKILPIKLDMEVKKAGLIASGSVIGILIILIVFLFIGAGVRKKQISHLILKEEAMTQQRSQVETVNNDISLLRAKMSALDQVTNRGFIWAEKLDQLSDLVLPGIWFTRISTDSDKTFIIEGSVISKKDEAMAAVGKFMKDIREYEAFFKDFANIKLESVQRKGIDERDVVDFRIVLYFRGPHGP